MHPTKKSTAAGIAGLLIVSTALAAAAFGAVTGKSDPRYGDKPYRFAKQSRMSHESDYRRDHNLRKDASYYSARTQPWTWVQPLPQGNELKAVQVLNPSLAWAVGGKGVIMKYNGADWRVDTMLNNIHFTALRFLDASNGWAVGYEGKIARYDGTKWSGVQSPAKYDLHDLYFTDATHGWAVGDRTILRYDGSSWSDVQSPIGDGTLFDVAFTGPNRGWACGGFEDYDSCIILKYNGTAWENVPMTVKMVCYGISFVDSATGWIVGFSQNNGGRILKYNGAAWNVFDSTTCENSLEAVDFVDAGHGWAVSNYGGILFFDGSSWKIKKEYSITGFFGVDFTDNNNGWAVGSCGALYKYKDAGWSAYCTGDQTDFYKMEMTGPADGWVVGDGGVIYRYNGTKWSGVKSPTVNSLFTVDFTDATHGWAAGSQGAIIRYTGSKWETVPSGSDSSLNGIHFIDANRGWVVGDKTILQWDGASWKSLPCPVDSALFDVGFAEAARGWAVGKAGAFVKYDGSSWTRDSLPGITYGDENADLLAIDFAGKSHGCIVGRNLIFMYDGQKWTRRELPKDLRDEYLMDVQYLSDTCLWIVGFNGSTLRYNGKKWMVVPTPAATLWAGYFTDPNHGWVCGEGLALLKGDITGYQFTETGKSAFAAEPEVFGARCVSRGDRLDLFGMPARGAFRYEIYTMRGEAVEKKTTAKKTIGIKALPPGAYVLQVTDNAVKRSFTFVKE